MNLQGKEYPRGFNDWDLDFIVFSSNNAVGINIFSEDLEISIFSAGTKIGVIFYSRDDFLDKFFQWEGVPLGLWEWGVFRVWTKFRCFRFEGVLKCYRRFWYVTSTRWNLTWVLNMKFPLAKILSGDYDMKLPSLKCYWIFDIKLPLATIQSYQIFISNFHSLKSYRDFGMIIPLAKINLIEILIWNFHSLKSYWVSWYETSTR